MIFNPNNNGSRKLDNKVDGLIHKVNRKALGGRANEFIHCILDAIHSHPLGIERLIHNCLNKDPLATLAIISRLLPKNIVHIDDRFADKKPIVVIQNIQNNNGNGHSQSGNNGKEISEVKIPILENSAGKIDNKATILESSFSPTINSPNSSLS